MLLCRLCWFTAAILPSGPKFFQRCISAKTNPPSRGNLSWISATLSWHSWAPVNAHSSSLTSRDVTLFCCSIQRSQCRTSRDDQFSGSVYNTSRQCCKDDDQSQWERTKSFVFAHAQLHAPICLLGFLDWGGGFLISFTDNTHARISMHKRRGFISLYFFVNLILVPVPPFQTGLFFHPSLLSLSIFHSVHP